MDQTTINQVAATQATDWIMIIITAVYVVATIAICYFNAKSAKAAKDQLEATQQQHDKMIALQCLPILQLESLTELLLPDHNFVMQLPLYRNEYNNTIVKVFALKNLGNGTAMNLTYTWKCDKYDISITDIMPLCAIRAGDSYNIKIEFDIDEDDLDEAISPCIEFEYTDILGQSYTQKVFLHHSDEAGFFDCENDSPKLFDKEYIGA